MSGVPRHPEFDFPRTGTLFQEMCERGREHNNRMYDFYAGWAAILERGLRRASGNPWLLGVDIKIAARRTVRPLLKAAEEHRRIAQNWVRMGHQFAEHFQGGSGSGRHSGGQRIDVMK
jgi:hypothetical protein